MIATVVVVVEVVIVVVETVVLTVAVKSVVWAGAVIDTLGELFGAVTIAFGVPLVSPTLYSGDVIDTLVIMLDIDVWFSCGAAFDCRPMAALDCAHVLQARMPSYHV